MEKIRELLGYKQMILSSIKKNLDAIYRRSVLGSCWLFINPLLQLWVYNIVFSEILQVETENYYIFLAAALIPWMFFSTSIVGGSRCILDAQDMVRKIYYPREVMPIAHATTALITMLLNFCAVIAILVFCGYGINLRVFVYFPLVVLIEYLFALGGTFLFSALTVYFRDMEFILGIIVMAWQFLTPVMYPREWVPDALGVVLDINPMTPIVDSYREIIYYQKNPDILLLLRASGTALIALILGYVVFEKLQKGFAEEL